MSEHHSHSHHHHHHSHDEDHHHAPKDFGRAFLIGIILNTLFILIEVIWGVKANSLALLADAGHNASDVMALFIAWGASWLVKRAPSDKFTYGLRSSSIIASLVNAITLLVVVGGIGWESIHRLFNPEEAGGIIVMSVAAVGVLINGITAWLFVSGHKDDLNIKSAYLHMLTTVNRTKFRYTCNIIHKTYTTSTLNTTRHRGFYDRAHIFIRHIALMFINREKYIPNIQWNHFFGYLPKNKTV